MERMRFTRNRQNTRFFGNFLAGNSTRPPCSLTLKCVRRYSSSQVTSDSVSRSETWRSVLFEIEIPCILPRKGGGGGTGNSIYKKGRDARREF